MADRTVHAEFPGVSEVVRYDLSGKWYIEPAASKRRLVGVLDAADEAVRLRNLGGRVHLGLPGGKLFDAAVRRK